MSDNPLRKFDEMEAQGQQPAPQQPDVPQYDTFNDPLHYFQNITNGGGLMNWIEQNQQLVLPNPEYWRSFYPQMQDTQTGEPAGLALDEENAQQRVSGYFDWLRQQPMDYYWENPVRLARWHTLDQNLPDAVQRPAWLNRDVLAGAYNYLQEKNQGLPHEQWKPLDANDPVRAILRQMPEPPVEDMPAWEQLALSKLDSSPEQLQQVLGQYALIQQTASRMLNPVPGLPNATPNLPTLQQVWDSLTLENAAALATKIGERYTHMETTLGIPKEQWDQLSAQEKIEAWMWGTPEGSVAQAALAGGANGLMAGNPVGGAVVGGAIGTGVQAEAAINEAFGTDAHVFESALNLLNIPSQMLEGFFGMIPSTLSEYRTMGQGVISGFDGSDERVAQAAQATGGEVFNLLNNAIQGKGSGLELLDVDRLKARWLAGQLFYETLGGAGTQNVWKRTLGKAGGEGWSIDSPNLSAQEQVLRWVEDDVYRKIKAGESVENVEQMYQPVITQLFGTNALWFNLAGSMAMDPLDMIPKAGTAAIGGPLAGAQKSLTGSDALGKAIFNPITEGPLKGSTEVRAPGEALKAYRQEVRSMPTHEAARMDAVTRWIAGVDSAGQDWKLSGKMPAAVRLFDQFFGATPESRAYEITRLSYDALNRTVHQMAEAGATPEEIVSNINTLAALTPEDYVKAAARGEELTLHGRAGGVETEMPIPRQFQSVELQPVLMSMKGSLEIVNTMLSEWRSVDPARVRIMAAAQALEMDPYTLTSKLLRGDAETAGIVNAAAAKGIQEANLLPKIAGLFFDPKTKKSKAPLGTPEFAARVALALTEGAENWAVQRLGVKPDGVVNRISALLKNAQGAVLFDLNPSYFLNNGINNIITMLWDGLAMRRYGKKYSRYLERFGKPSFSEQGLTPAEYGKAYGNVYTEAGLKALDAEPMGSAIRKAKGADDAIARMDDFIGRTRGKFGLFSKLSSWAEPALLV